MNRTLISALLSAVLACSIPAPLPGTVAKAAETPESVYLEEGTYEEGQVLVTLASPKKTPLTKEGQVSFDSHLTVEDSWNFGDATVLADTPEQRKFLEDKTLYVTKVSSESYSTAAIMEKLDHQAYVVDVEPDYYRYKASVSNDPLADYQWYLGGTDTFSEAQSTGINYAGYDQQTSSSSPVVAVVDTGIDYNHEDLRGHMWQNTHGSLAGIYGYDFGDSDTDPMDTDEDGHGTHCAGVIGALNNNNVGVSGVASDVRLMALKVFNNDGHCYSSSVIAAFNYIYQAQMLGENIVAVNCSWGGGGSTSTLMSSLIDKIGKKGALFIFAAGNDGKNHDYSPTKECPYDLNSPYAVIVGASTPTDSRARYSDYGGASVDLFSPGYHILSTVNTDVFFPAIYSSAKRQELCRYYTPCDTADNLLRTPSDLGMNSTSMINSFDIDHSTWDYFGKNTGSYRISINSFVGQRSKLSVYLDVTDLDLDPSATYYTACNLGIPSEGEISWDHGFYRRYAATNAEHFVQTKGRSYLLLITLEGKLSSLSTLYLDNIAISKENPDTSQFGKYNVYDGTSMAAPSVTGAAALLALAYPSDTARQRCERLLTCVRKADALASDCKTGGILDLSKIPEATYTSSADVDEEKSTTTPSKKVKVTKITLNKKKATLRYKKKLKLKATVKPTKATNKKVKWYVSNKKYASVTQKGVVKAKKKGIGHTVKVYAKAKDGSGKKAYCKVKIKKKK